MKSPNLSIFQRLLLSLAGTGVLVALVSGLVHYLFAVGLIETSMRNQMRSDLRASLSHFERTYTVPVSGALRLLEQSPVVNELLSSAGPEAYLIKPVAERLFLSVAGTHPQLYKSVRFIAEQGVERVAVRAGKRLRRYATVTELRAGDSTERELANFFSRLEHEPPATVHYTGPIELDDGSYVMLAGITKREPDIGGFGGAIIIEVDLSQYLEYLSRLTVFGHALVWVLDHDGRALLMPASTDASLDPRPYLDAAEETPIGAVIFSSDDVDSDKTLGMFRLVLSMSPQTYRLQLEGAEKIFALVLAAIVGFAALGALVLARQLAAPVRALSRMTDAVSRGDLDAHVPPTWGGELGQLAAAFNDMLDSLRVTTVSVDYVNDIIQSMTDTLVVTDLDGTIQKVNDTLCHLLGYEEAELLGEPLGTILEESELQDRVMVLADDGESLHDVETGYVSKTGQSIPVSFSSALLAGRGGVHQGYVCVAQDVRERHRAEAALLQESRSVQLLQRIAVAANKASVVSEAIQVCLDEVCSLTGWPVGHAFDFSDCPPGNYDGTHVWHLDSPRSFAEFRTATEAWTPVPRERGLVSRVIETAEPVWMRDASKRSDFKRARQVGDIRVKAGFAFPVVVGNEVKAVIEFFATEEHEPDERLLGLMSNVGTQLSRVIERKFAENRLRASENRYRALYDDNPSMFVTLDDKGIILSINDFGAHQLGYDVAQLVGRNVLALHRADCREKLVAQLEACLQEPHTVHRWETCKMRRDSSELWVRVSARAIDGPGGRPQLLVVCEDATEAHDLSLKLTHQATHDALTGLANRHAFEERLRQILEAARVDGAQHALCYLDLDQFKVINDTCGHVAGDELLRQVGAMLRSQVRKSDTLARLGGDEFGVLMESCTIEQAHRVANALRRAVDEFRFLWEDKSFNIGVSIGMVPVTAASGDITSVMSAADTACYTAKDQGRNRIHVFHPDDHELARRFGEMQRVAQINRALEQDRLHLCFQPIAAIGPDRNADRLDCGHHYELLLRMEDDDGQIIAPGGFLPAAERYNLSSKLDQWVVEKTFMWLVGNPGHLEELALCSINLSGQSLGDQEFFDFVVDKLESSGVPGNRICFEITETAAITNLTSATNFITTLKRLGCLFALDDFGSGLSSFAYLKTLPVDFLKIDGVFVKDIVDDPVDLAMVKAINQMGHAMGKKTIAEFVENEAILSKLREMGVDYAQGYAIGRPQPIEVLVRKAAVGT